MKLGDYFQGKYIRASDLPHPVKVRIREFKVEEVGQDRERRLVAYFEGGRKGLVVSPGHARTLEALFGNVELEEMVGRELVLWNDPSVVYQGRVGGVRIRAVAGGAHHEAPARPGGAPPRRGPEPHEDPHPAF